MKTTATFLAIVVSAQSAVIAHQVHTPVLVRAVAAAPSEETVGELIAKGRALLAQGQASLAESVFAEAEKLDKSSIQTRMWTLRSWLPQGRVNDALEAIDKLDRAGQKGSEMDYLYGMAFAAKAKGYLKEPAPGPIIEMAFTDAATFLEKATKSDPVRYCDAFMPLAESAWYARNLPLARTAADKACAVAPQDPEAFAILGQVAMAQFVGANGAEGGGSSGTPEQKSAADAHWEAARAANARAAELLTAAGTPTAKVRAAAVHVELARAFGWKKKSEDAGREYALALGCDPSAVDFGEVRGALDGAGFVAALEAGQKNYTANWGTEGSGDATLLWWLGYAQFDQKQNAAAEVTFQAAVKKRADYCNSWFYVALARYNQQHYEAAVAALRQNFECNPSDLVASINQNRDHHIPIIDYLVGWCAQQQKPLDAAFLTEVETAVAPEWAPYWSNLGLFYRDAGDALVRKKGSEDKDKALAKELWEKALRAYEKAFALSPDDPNILCDLAVVLHYNLRRDLERAKTLYEQSLARATELLKRADLTPGDRDRYETAKKDSGDNLSKMAREIERQKKEQEEKDKKGTPPPKQAPPE